MHSYVTKSAYHYEIVVLVLTRVAYMTNYVLFFGGESTLWAHTGLIIIFARIAGLLYFVVTFEPLEPLVIQFVMGSYKISNIFFFCVNLFPAFFLQYLEAFVLDHVLKNGLN